MQVQSFPIKTQIGIFKNEEDIIDWMLKQDDSQILAIDYMTFIKHAPLIFTSQINEFLMRFNLLKSHNILSYGNVLDELPAVWVDALQIMEVEFNKALRVKRGNKTT